MPFGLIMALGVGVFAITLNEKQKRENVRNGSDSTQQRVGKHADGSYRDAYGNTYQKLDDGSLIAIPGREF